MRQLTVITLMQYAVSASFDRRMNSRGKTQIAETATETTVVVFGAGDNGL